MDDTATRFSALRKGLLEFAVLKIVARRKVYAADILASLERTDFATGEGTLYPLLSRLKREGALDYDWQESEAGPPRKYYSLTPSGTQRLQELDTYWRKLNTTLNDLGGEQ